jgi:hypothetical protein
MMTYIDTFLFHFPDWLKFLLFDANSNEDSLKTSRFLKFCTFSNSDLFSFFLNQFLGNTFVFKVVLLAKSE